MPSDMIERLSGCFLPKPALCPEKQPFQTAIIVSMRKSVMRMTNAVYWANKGFDSIAYSLDAAVFINAFQDLTAQFRRETGANA